MKLREYQRSWQKVDLTRLRTGGAHSPAGPELYEQFYIELAQGRGGPDQRWSTSKQTLGAVVADEVFEAWRRRSGRDPRILALAAGTGAAEGVWLERGYDVTLHDCQDVSLRALRERFPRSGVLIADLRTIVIPGGFDIIVMLASEYVLSEDELAGLVRTAETSVADGGWIVLHSVSVLSAVRFAKESLKRLARRLSSDEGVFWGWFRTPGELARSGVGAGLQIVAVYRVITTEADETVLKSRPRWLRTLPTLRDESVLAVFERG